MRHYILERASRSLAETGLFLTLLRSFSASVFCARFEMVFSDTLGAFGCLWEVILEAFWTLLGDFFVIRGKSEN